MTTPFADDASPTPPPGCPAHGLQAEGLRRLYGPEAEADPAGLYEKLRAEHGEVAPVLLHGDLPAWLILGHSANLTAMRTPSRFSRDSRRWTAFQQGLVAPDSPLMPVIAWQPLCVFADGEEHKRLRGAVTDSLNRFDRRGIRRYVTRFTDQLIQDFGPAGQAELVAQFAEHLPMLVMTQVVGMPEEYGPRLVEAARDLMKGTETAIASNDYVVATLRRMMERKRVAPGADLVSWLMQHDAGLTDDEVLEHLRVVLLAANETTVNLIADTLKLVLTDRRFRAHLSGGHMTLPDALDQVLWDTAPMSVVAGRWATGDTELGGRQIKTGDMLLLGLAAGNVDPVVRPDLSTPLYGNRSHLAFGGGPHECPGQDIGRAIAETGIDILLTRLPDLQLAVPEEELTWTSAWLSRHLAGLPVRFTPRPRGDGETGTVGGAVPGTAPATPATPATAVPAQSVAPLAAQAQAQAQAQAVTIPRQRRSWWSTLTGRFRR
ncbi:cytochrome P450 [Kitasatospora herbaricolor]|uniref:cytochrome P450 n=1 Tax=Kitasatospora herbaricolor TaxID=68217 RepID=UPI00174E9AF2|nr:cytochrome P450 [Kitasatospora herbaricolor]MDQ0309925.1 cytochrome P450 [Kitasatospora herbaricolor]GGV32641.1 cytochrome P450 [Kitasatospora herbaricolor]